MNFTQARETLIRILLKIHPTIVIDDSTLTSTLITVANITRVVDIPVENCKGFQDAYNLLLELQKEAA